MRDYSLLAIEKQVHSIHYIMILKKEGFMLLLEKWIEKKTKKSTKYLTRGGGPAIIPVHKQEGPPSWGDWRVCETVQERIVGRDL